MESRCSIRTDNDFLLAGLFELPSGSKEAPLVLLFHGFTGWKEERHIATLAKRLSERGIASLRFDAPGSGESSGTFGNEYRLTNYLSSVGPILRFAHTLPVDTMRIAVWGHSMGGFVALESAVRYQSDIRAVCGSQPSMGWQGLPAAQVESWKADGWMEFSNERFPRIRLPYAFYEDRLQYNALETVGHLRVPLLLLAGTNDDVVPADGVRRIFDAASEPKHYLEFPVGHDYAFDTDGLYLINDATVDFFFDVLH